METVFYDPAGKTVATLRGQHTLAALPIDDPTDYRIEYRLTADDVRTEASNRMQVLVGARDASHLDIIIANGAREAIRLLRKGSTNWTEAEAKRAAEIEAIDIAIEQIRHASNLMEADPPADFSDDRHWPMFP